MKTVREVLRRSPIWINPGHTAETVAILMHGHQIGALPVLDGSALVGVIGYTEVLGARPESAAGDLMRVDVPAASPEMTVKEAADLMARAGTGRLPVLEDGRLVGFVTHGDLLPEVGRSFDPLTQLPWADSLREWAIEELKRGHEITVLFIDLNRFGYFNKRYGHLVGDAVLRAFADVLRSLVDEDTDFLCRYGGDEFCLGTLRPADDAVELAARIQRRVGEVQVEGAEEEKVSCSVGQFGGKRTREREHTHFAATLNSLINLASRDCIANKASSAESDTSDSADGTGAEFAENARLRLAWIDVEWSGSTAQVRVDLQLQRPSSAPPGDSLAFAEQSLRFPSTLNAKTDSEGVLHLIAEATTCSLQRILPEGYSFKLSGLLTNKTPEGQTLLTAVGQYVTPGQSLPVAGSVVVGSDPYRSAASAVLSAINRLVGRIPASLLATRETARNQAR